MEKCSECERLEALVWELENEVGALKEENHLAKNDHERYIAKLEGDLQDMKWDLEEAILDLEEARDDEIYLQKEIEGVERDLEEARGIARRFLWEGISQPQVEWIQYPWLREGYTNEL